jgi:hypothetical protein
MKLGFKLNIIFTTLLSSPAVEEVLVLSPSVVCFPRCGSFGWYLGARVVETVQVMAKAQQE